LIKGNALQQKTYLFQQLDSQTGFDPAGIDIPGIFVHLHERGTAFDESTE
jgi:hypothetical protein